MHPHTPTKYIMCRRSLRNVRSLTFSGTFRTEISGHYHQNAEHSRHLRSAEGTNHQKLRAIHSSHPQTVPHFHHVTRSHTGNSRNAILEATFSQMPDIGSACAGNPTNSPESHGCTVGYHASRPHSGYPQNVFLAFFSLMKFSTALRKPAIFH